MTITVRLDNLDGPALGAFAHPTVYLADTVELGERTYLVVASAEGQARQTLAVVAQDQTG